MMNRSTNLSQNAWQNIAAKSREKCPVMLWRLCCTKEEMKMLIDYPMEWRKYMIKGKTRTFSENTPQEIVEKVKELNKKAIRDAGKPFFFFEENR